MTQPIELTGEVPEDLSDANLLANYQELTHLVQHYQRHLGLLEYEILQRMVARESIAIPSDIYTCELKTSSTYNHLAFTPLKEILTEGDLNTCLSPAHEETVQVPDKWNTTKVKAMARRYGADAQKIVEQANMPGPNRLKFERRE